MLPAIAKHIVIFLLANLIISDLRLHVCPLTHTPSQIGQAFAGLNANTVFYNFTTAVAMMIGRFGLAIPALALAGLVAQQVRKREVGNAVPTDGPLFAGLLIATALIVGGLSFFPALTLGPILEHLIRR